MAKRKGNKRKSSEDYGTFSGFVAHELRTPLSSMSVYLDLLQSSFYSKILDEKLSKKDKEKIFNQSFDICKYTVKVAAQIIDNILVNLKNVALGNIKTTNFEINTIDKDIKKAVDDYPYQDGERQLVSYANGNEFVYLGDSQLTKHMFYNLLKNALKATKEAGKGNIVIKTETNDIFNQVLFTDTALGLPDSDVVKIFDRFETKDLNGTGAGLGLAFCKLVMGSYGGNIECRSELGKYTTFILSFPKLNTNNS